MSTPNFRKFTDGLVPAIIQDAASGAVLMLGYMNEDAWKQTQITGKVVFFSRSKQRLWMKGESSGNVLNVISATLDCDQDCLLIQAIPAGAVCHTGDDTCFGITNKWPRFLSELEQIIMQRRTAATSESYVGNLFDKGINSIAQKVGEEAVELIIEAKDNDDTLFLNEAADLLFHYLILLQSKGYFLSDVSATLQSRHMKAKNQPR